MSRMLQKASIAGLFFVALSIGPSSLRPARGAASPGCPDNDMDGTLDWQCGGGDCDDSDPTSYPGAPEVCDAAGHDEDCEPYNFGHKDDDLDGEIDLRCYNKLPDGTIIGGSDVDDSNPAIQSGAQICNGGDNVWVYAKLAGSNGAGVAPKPCPTGTKCVPQPNGTGVCMTPPPGYHPPPNTSSTSTQPALPSVQSLLAKLRPTKKPSLAPTKAPPPIKR